MKIRSVHCYFSIIFSTLLLLNFVESKEIEKSDQIIDGIKFRSDSVKMYGNGKLSSGVLTENQEIQRMKFKAGSGVEFDENGKLIFR